MQIYERHERDDHGLLFKKPKYTETTTALGSENSGLYRKYVPLQRDLDLVIEFFKFEEKKRRGFSSPYLTKNPYENDFYAYVEELEAKYSNLPSSVAHGRLLAEIEVKHKLALTSLK